MNQPLNFNYTLGLSRIFSIYGCLHMCQFVCCIKDIKGSQIIELGFLISLLQQKGLPHHLMTRTFQSEIESSYYSLFDASMAAGFWEKLFFDFFH